MEVMRNSNGSEKNALPEELRTGIVFTYADFFSNLDGDSCAGFIAPLGSALPNPQRFLPVWLPAPAKACYSRRGPLLV
jgi:hypothetical protein